MKMQRNVLVFLFSLMFLFGFVSAELMFNEDGELVDENGNKVLESDSFEVNGVQVEGFNDAEFSQTEGTKAKPLSTTLRNDAGLEFDIESVPSGVTKVSYSKLNGLLTYTYEDGKISLATGTLSEDGQYLDGTPLTKNRNIRFEFQKDDGLGNGVTVLEDGSFLFGNEAKIHVGNRSFTGGINGSLSGSLSINDDGSFEVNDVEVETSRLKLDIPKLRDGATTLFFEKPEPGALKDLESAVVAYDDELGFNALLKGSNLRMSFPEDTDWSDVNYFSTDGTGLEYTIGDSSILGSSTHLFPKMSELKDFQEYLVSTDKFFVLNPEDSSNYFVFGKGAGANIAGQGNKNLAIIDVNKDFPPFEYPNLDDLRWTLIGGYESQGGLKSDFTKGVTSLYPLDPSDDAKQYAPNPFLGDTKPQVLVTEFYARPNEINDFVENHGSITQENFGDFLETCSGLKCRNTIVYDQLSMKEYLPKIKSAVNELNLPRIYEGDVDSLYSSLVTQTFVNEEGFVRSGTEVLIMYDQNRQPNGGLFSVSSPNGATRSVELTEPLLRPMLNKLAQKDNLPYVFSNFREEGTEGVAKSYKFVRTNKDGVDVFEPAN